MSTKFSIGQMNQLADALEAAGFTPADVTKLRSPEMLSKFKLMLGEKANIVVKKHLINCDADPFLPEDLYEICTNRIITHRKGGRIEWNPDKFELHFRQEKPNREDIINYYLENKPFVVNTCVLEYLLEYSELIPEEWKCYHIFFFGTLYETHGGYPHALCLYWDGNKWRSGSEWVMGIWRDINGVILIYNKLKF